MFKTLTFIALILCTTTFLRASCTLEKAPIVRHLEISTAQSSTVPFGGHLYTVSKNESHIHVNSSDSNYHPCDIEIIDPNRDVIIGKFEMTATEKEIYIVGEKTMSAFRGYTYTILRIDPTTCTYQAASIPEINDKRGRYFLPKLVKHRTNTDVFFPSLKKCAPCRLNKAGLRDTGTVRQLPRETNRPGAPFQVQYIEPTNSYFYVYNIETILAKVEDASLKFLDADDFRTVKERSLNIPVHALSKQKSSIEHLGICSKIYEGELGPLYKYKEIRCDKLNSSLDTVNTIRIPMGPDPKFISRISYEFDKEGNSYIGFAEDTKLQLYIHDKDGKLVKAFDLGEIDEKFIELYDGADLKMFFNPADYWDVRGFLVGDQYCMVTEQVATNNPAPLHDVKCISVKK